MYISTCPHLYQVIDNIHVYNGHMKEYKSCDVVWTEYEVFNELLHSIDYKPKHHLERRSSVMQFFHDLWIR